MARYLPLVVASLTLIACGANAPQPLRVVAFLDTSKSSFHLRPQMSGFLEDFVGRLDRHLDKLVVYKVDATVGLLYSGEAWRGPALRDTLAHYLKEATRKGTGYGAALHKAQEETKIADREKRRPIVVMLGDWADEPGPGVVNLKPREIPAVVKALGPDCVLGFAYVTPDDHFTETYRQFQEAYGEGADHKLQFSTPEGEARHQVRNFLLEQVKR